LLQRLFHDFAPQHNNDYACVAKTLQLRVSLRFALPRYDAYSKIWVKYKCERINYPSLWCWLPRNSIAVPEKGKKVILPIRK
jgi:hypothetical protein